MSFATMIGRMECSSCARCCQRMVLGYRITNSNGKNAFTCCGCIDRYGVDEVADVVQNDYENTAQNENVLSKAPQRLSEVPDGFLHLSELGIRCQDYVETFNVVSDPDHNYFKGHGAERVWPAAIMLADYLLRPCGRLQRKKRRFLPELSGLRIVELGAGCGFTGIALARLAGADVTLTDLPWTLQLASFNVQANFAPDDECLPKVSALQWGFAADIKAIAAEGPTDLAIGADIVYRTDDLADLFKSFDGLAAQRVVLAIVDREGIMQSFEDATFNLGWDVCVCEIDVSNGMMIVQLSRTTDDPPLFDCGKHRRNN